MEMHCHFPVYSQDNACFHVDNVPSSLKTAVSFLLVNVILGANGNYLEKKNNENLRKTVSQLHDLNLNCLVISKASIQDFKYICLR